MNTNLMPVAANNDVELVNGTLLGKRDAFGQIVARYQSLICSLAYSATGSLSQSEDLAQETFITAWKHLRQLRERDKLRAWLCGIARNRINSFLRREGREPVREAGPLENAAGARSPEPLPVEYTISNEEQAILWRSLERIPEIYREPFVLFYREHQSVEAVAHNLDLTEDTVKQRLSRGRKLLQEQVLAFVEGALERTAPGKAFTLAVLASLPALPFSAKAATIGIAAKAGATTKTAGAMGLLGALFGPLVVFLPNYLGYRIALAGAQSEVERAGVKTFYGRLAVITLALFVPLAAIVLWLTWNQPERGYLSGVFATLLVLIFLPTMFVLVVASKRKTREYYLRTLSQEYAGVFPKAAWEYRSRANLFGMPLVHIVIGDRFAALKKPVTAWIAVGNRAFGGLFAFGALAVAPVSIGGFVAGFLSFGGLSVGMIALGGIAAGVWPLFGGALVGWQAFDGCFAIGWNATAGAFALAHDFALGRFVHAAQANNEAARNFIFPNPFFRCAEFINRHWLWLNLLWLFPFFTLWQTSKKSKPMNKNTFLIVTALASALAAAGCNKAGKLSQPSTITPNGPVELKLKWPAGERVVQEIDLKMNMEISVPGQPNPIKQDMNLGQKYGITVLNAAADGSRELAMEILSVRMKLEQSGRTLIDYDSEKKTAPGSKDKSLAAIEKMFENVVGAKLQLHLDPSNNVSRIEGADELMSRLETGGPPEATSSLKNLFSADYLKQMVGNNGSFPPNPVQPGDSWPVRMDVPLGDFGTLATDYHYTFQSWEQRGPRTCARLEFDGTLKSKSGAKSDAAGMAMTIQSGTVSGVTWFDPELGMAIDSVVNQDINMVMSIPIPVRGRATTQTMTNLMRQTVTRKLESVK